MKAKTSKKAAKKVTKSAKSKKVAKVVASPKKKINISDKEIEKLNTFGQFVEVIRKNSDVSQIDFANKLGISKSHLCDIEKGRKGITAERAQKFAQVLNQPELHFIRLTLQEELHNAGLKYRVKLERA